MLIHNKTSQSTTTIRAQGNKDDVCDHVEVLGIMSHNFVAYECAAKAASRQCKVEPDESFEARQLQPE